MIRFFDLKLIVIFFFFIFLSLFSSSCSGGGDESREYGIFNSDQITNFSKDNKNIVEAKSYTPLYTYLKTSQTPHSYSFKTESDDEYTLHLVKGGFLKRVEIAQSPSASNQIQRRTGKNGRYIFPYLNNVGNMVNWGGSVSEGLVLIPQSSWTTIAHKRGALSLGLIFMPPSAFGGSSHLVEKYLKGKAQNYFDIAKSHNFDGWLINAESPGGELYDNFINDYNNLIKSHSEKNHIIRKYGGNDTHYFHVNYLTAKDKTKRFKDSMVHEIANANVVHRDDVFYTDMDKNVSNAFYRSLTLWRGTKFSFGNYFPIKTSVQNGLEKLFDTSATFTKSAEIPGKTEIGPFLTNFNVGWGNNLWGFGTYLTPGVLEKSWNDPALQEILPTFQFAYAYTRNYTDNPDNEIPSFTYKQSHDFNSSETYFYNAQTYLNIKVPHNPKNNKSEEFEKNIKIASARSLYNYLKGKSKINKGDKFFALHLIVHENRKNEDALPYIPKVQKFSLRLSNHVHNEQTLFGLAIVCKNPDTYRKEYSVIAYPREFNSEFERGGVRYELPNCDSSSDPSVKPRDYPTQVYVYTIQKKGNFHDIDFSISAFRGHSNIANTHKFEVHKFSSKKWLFKMLTEEKNERYVKGDYITRVEHSNDVGKLKSVSGDALLISDGDIGDKDQFIIYTKYGYMVAYNADTKEFNNVDPAVP